MKLITDDPLSQALSATAKAIERKLDVLLPVPEGPEGRVVDAMRYALFAGGKRLRPFLVLASADLFEVSRDSALRVAAAIECVHTYSLIHDDLPAMDDDDVRRGQPTVHKEFDDATAILAGDGLLTFAFHILADDRTHPDPRVRCELIQSLAQAAGHHGMVGGQMIDLAAENNPLSQNEISRLQQLKTGALICFSAEAGGILGRTTEHHRHSLIGYARALGLAFQIADDLLDVEGDEQTVGKASGKDADAGKATFVSLMGVDRARQQAKLLADQAIDHLKDFGERAALLRAVAHFVVDRDK